LVENAEWWTAIGTVSAVFAALFLENIREFWNRPRLERTVRMGKLDRMKTTITDGAGRIIADCYWFRVMVENKGRGRANQVEIHAESLRDERESLPLCRLEIMPARVV
jgi:hypothetical protein